MFDSRRGACHPEVVAYGGMRGAGVPIGARAIARPGTDSPGAGGSAPSPARPGRADLPLHCWVSHDGPAARAVAGDTGDTARSPGILLEWRHEADRWWGMVVFVAGDDGGRPVVVTRLLPAEALAPA